MTTLAFAARDSGLIVEEKGGLSVALHFRLAGRHAEAAKACARDLARQTGLTLQDGDMVEELRTLFARAGTSGFPGQGKRSSARIAAIVAKSSILAARRRETSLGISGGSASHSSDAGFSESSGAKGSTS